MCSRFESRRPALRRRRAEAAPPAAEVERGPAAAQASAFDPEIAAIFAEEAAEILDNSQAALQDVRQRQDHPAVGMLQRFLHTLKGGARMAGVLSMGDLSHAVETLLSRIAQSRDQATPAALDLVQRGLDDLQQMRDAIDAGRAPSATPGLIGQLEGFDAGRGEAAAAAPAGQRGPAATASPLAAESRRVEAPVPPRVEPVATVDLTEADLAELAKLDEIELGPPSALAVEPLEEPTIEEEALDIDEAGVSRGSDDRRAGRGRRRCGRQAKRRLQHRRRPRLRPPSRAPSARRRRASMRDCSTCS